MNYQNKIVDCSYQTQLSRACRCKLPTSYLMEDKGKDSYNLFDILSHNFAATSQKQRQTEVSKAPKNGKITVCSCLKHSCQFCRCKSPTSNLVDDKEKDSSNLFNILAHSYAATRQNHKSIEVSKAPKHPNKIAVCACPKHICQACSCKSLNLGLLEDKRKDSDNLFDILAHNYVATLQEQKSVKTSKAPKTTYGQDYCPKRMPTYKKVDPPFSSFYASDEKMSSKTTHKIDFKSYSEESKKDVVGKREKPENNLKCLSGKLAAKSETKSSYKKPTPKKCSTGNKPILRERKFLNKDNITIPATANKRQPLASDTTYSKAYKVPKVFQKTKIHVPKPDIHKIDSSKAFKDISQYRSDFKRPKKVNKECVRKLQIYCEPNEPMENKTIYRVDYTPKKPIGKKTPMKNFSINSTCRLDVNRMCCPCIHNGMICQAAC